MSSARRRRARRVPFASPPELAAPADDALLVGAPSVILVGMRTLGLLIAVMLAGCFDHGQREVVPGPVPDFAVPVYDSGAPPQQLADGGGDLLGSGRAQPMTTAPLHIQANASINIPPGQVGFAVTADGLGGYRVAWVDTASANRRYHGSVFDDGTFSQISAVGMQYATANGGRLDFESAPGAGSEGYVDFVSSVDPIVVDGLVGASGGTLFYVDAGGLTRAVPTPATFTSP
jgi:hypothetical protein